MSTKKLVKVVSLKDRNLVALFVSCSMTAGTKELYGKNEAKLHIENYQAKGFKVVFANK